MARYKSLAEEAANLEAILAERFPQLDAEDREQFCASALHKIAGIYSRGGYVMLATIDEFGIANGGYQRLLITGKEVRR